MYGNPTLAADHTKFGIDIKPIFLKNGNTANKLVYTFMDPPYGMIKKMIDSSQGLNASDPQKVLNNDDENQTNKFLTYTNDNYGISLHYPTDWRKEEVDTTPRDYDIEVVQFYSPQSRAPGKYNAEFSIMIRMYGEENAPKNVDEELEFVIDRGYIWSTNFNIAESNTNTTLAGYPAYKIVWTETIDDTLIKVMEMGIIIKGDAYIVEYRAEPGRYSIFSPIVQQMIDSLEIK
jgi:hypothetical protein